MVPSTRLAASPPIDYCPKPRPPQLQKCTLPQQKSNNILCLSKTICIVFFIWLVSGKNSSIWLFRRQCKQASSPLSAPSFSFLRKILLRNILTERWACYWLSCFKSGLQLKDSEIKVSFGFSAPLGDNFWNKYKGCAQQLCQKLVSKKCNQFYFQLFLFIGWKFSPKKKFFTAQSTCWLHQFPYSCEKAGNPLGGL